MNITSSHLAALRALLAEMTALSTQSWQQAGQWLAAGIDALEAGGSRRPARIRTALLRRGFRDWWGSGSNHLGSPDCAQ